LSQLLLKITSLQFSHQIFNVSALLLDDASKPATPLTNGAIVREFVTCGFKMRKNSRILTIFF